MSLIQDALKRKSEEAPEIIPPVTPKENINPIKPSVAEDEAKDHQSLLIILLIIALLVALGGLAFSLIRPSKHTVTPMTVKPKAITEIAEKAPIAQPAVIQVSEPLLPTIITDPVTNKIPVPEIIQEWPELKLTGIASSDSQRIAIINGKMLSVGRTFGEVIIREVSETQAVVEFRGERRVLHVDE